MRRRRAVLRSHGRVAALANGNFDVPFTLPRRLRLRQHEDSERRKKRCRTRCLDSPPPPFEFLFEQPSNDQLNELVANERLT
jgi:hypothetical protein